MLCGDTHQVTHLVVAEEGGCASTPMELVHLPGHGRTTLPEERFPGAGVQDKAMRARDFS